MARVGTTAPRVDIAFGSGALHGTFNRWTFHLWIHSDTAPAGAGEAAFDLSNSGAVYDGGYLFDHPTASFQSAVYLKEAGGAYRTAQGTLKTKAWNAVTGRFDGTNLTNVTNFAVANTACADPSTTSPDASVFSLPASRGGNNCFRRLGRVTLWDVPLSFSEIFFLQNGGDPKELTWRNSSIQFDYLMEADNFIDTMKRRNGLVSGTIDYFPGPALPQAPLRRHWPSAPTGAGVTGTIASTEANDALAATGSVKTVGTIATTEAADVLAASGFLGFTGTIATTEAKDVLAATGKVYITGTAPLVESADVLAATGTVSQPARTGTIGLVEAGDTFAASGSSGATDRGGIISRSAIKRLKRKAEDERKRRESTWEAGLLASKELVEQVTRAMDGAPTVAVQQAVPKFIDDEEEEIEMLLMAA